MSKLDELLSDDMPIKHCCRQGGTDIEASKKLLKEFFLELLDESAKTAYSGSQHVEIFRKKVEGL